MSVDDGLTFPDEQQAAAPAPPAPAQAPAPTTKPHMSISDLRKVAGESPLKPGANAQNEVPAATSTIAGKTPDGKDYQQSPLGEDMSNIADAGLGIVKGVATTLDKAAIALNKESARANGEQPTEVKQRLDSLLPDVGTPGAVTAGITEFAIGMAGVGKFTKAVGILSKVPGMAKSAIDAGLTGSAVMDPYEHRLSNLMEAHPSLANPITAFLSADPKNGEVTARFKAFVENAGLGAAGEGLFKLLGAFREARPLAAAGKGAKAAQIMDSAAQDAHETATAPAPVADTAPTPKAGAPADTASAAVPPAPNGAPEVAKAIDHSHDVPYGGGAAADNSKVEVDRGIPTSMDFGNGKTGNPVETVGLHESTEKALRDKGMSYEDAHEQATQIERAAVEKAGGDWDTYSKNLEPYLQQARAKAAAGNAAVDPNLDKSIYTGADKKLVENATAGGPDAQVRGGVLTDASGNMPVPPAGSARSTNFTQMVAEQAAKGQFDYFGPVLGKDFNFNHFQETSAKQIINYMSDRMVNSDIRSVESRQATTELAGMLSADPVAITQALASHAANAEQTARVLVAGKQYMQYLGQNIADLAKRRNFKLDNGEDGADDLSRMQALVGHLNEIQENVKLVQKGAARATGSGNIDIKPITLDPQTAELLGCAQTPGQVSRMIEAAKSPLTKAINVLNDIHVNALLSGAASVMTHVTGVLANMVIMPTEKYLLGAGLTGSPRLIREGGAYVMGMWKGMFDSSRLAGRAMYRDAPILEHGGIREYEPAISPQAFGMDPMSVAGQVVSGTGKFVGLPVRLRIGLDEYTKQISYRGFMSGKALTEARAQGLTGDAVGQYIEQRVEGSMASDSGRANDMAGTEWAAQNAFTQRIPANSFTGGIQRLLAQHPAGRLLIPFLKVPYNLLVSGALDRTPGLNLLREQYASDFYGKNGTDAAALARGKMMTGMALIGGAGYLAAAGVFTGSGPASQVARQQLKQTGWQPYSVKMPDGTYVSYARCEPFATHLGIIADAFDIMAHLGEKDASDVALSVSMATAHNLMSKLYLQGLSQGIDAMSDPSRHMQRWINQFGAGFVPGAMNSAAAITGQADPYMRETRNLIDSLRAKIPGISEGLPPVRNLVGDPVVNRIGIGQNGWNPLTVTHTTNEPWALEVGRLEAPISALPTKVGNVQLTPQQHDRWGELLQTYQPTGEPTLKGKLNELISSDMYQHTLTDSSMDYQGSRAKEIDNTVKLYREGALIQLQKEDKGLGETIKQDKMQKMMAMLMPGQQAPQQPPQPGVTP